MRVYDNLFSTPKPDEEEDRKSALDPESPKVLTGCNLDPSLKDAATESRFHVEPQGYFCADSRDSSSRRLVFNRTVALRDTWVKIEKAGG